jgi:predicted GNAT family acetyltransferase
MTWRVTDSLDEFLAAAGDHLRADPVQYTVPLTVLETLREAGLKAFGDSPPVFGWHAAADGAIDGAFFRTPPFPVLIASLPPGSADSLVELVAASRSEPVTVNVTDAAEPAVLAAWAARTGGVGTTRMRARLFRLGVLTPPDPMPPGDARLADIGDQDLLVDWTVAFSQETGASDPGRAARAVADRLSHDGLMLWEIGGVPVAMAGLTREVAGVVRVLSVYTPPAHRRRGYGGAVTTTVSRAALAAGVSAVLLFTDLANPTTNALYQRLGYRPIGDRVEVSLTPGKGHRSDVTGDSRATSKTS